MHYAKIKRIESVNGKQVGKIYDGLMPALPQTGHSFFMYLNSDGDIGRFIHTSGVTDVMKIATISENIPKIIVFKTKNSVYELSYTERPNTLV